MSRAAAPPLLRGFAAAALLTATSRSPGARPQHPPRNEPPSRPQADLADRDFTAERYQPVVLSVGGAADAPPVISEAERAAAEAKFGRVLQVPRRPPWDASTTPEQLEANEKQAFLDWRRWGPRRRRFSYLVQGGVAGWVLDAAGGKCK